ncbi:hypothetical protein SNEBB_003616 [Seison nebaliae]|nr:hypothetical protein SNEBB_003616 [Seison nebaliae]
MSTNMLDIEVGTIRLRDANIVTLTIDGEQRLCLAQISNSLLYNYTYNEIHNRRVALGILCVQCTPPQLEVLRRYNALPPTSRRCGMISLKEAKRLITSFLDEPKPLNLDKNYSFQVRHSCAWGAFGSFQPNKYSSSRAKCIECYTCHNLFSPNKFIFHSHKKEAAKPDEYVQPNAANFNAWRRHLQLIIPSNIETNSDEYESFLSQWEDVKSIYNGGSRKRTMNGNDSKRLYQLNEKEENFNRLCVKYLKGENELKSEWRKDESKSFTIDSIISS